MPEFSESIYLRSQSREDGIEWLRRNNREGYVYEPRGEWVQVLPKWPGFFNYDKEALQHSPSLLVYYVFGETDRWLVWIYDGENRLFDCQCSLSDPAPCEFDEAALATVADRLDVAETSLRDALIGDDSQDSGQRQAQRARRFCEALGLPNYRETSFEYAREEPPSNDFDVIYVDDNKQLRAGRDSEFVERLQQMSVDADKIPSTVAEGVVIELLERELMTLAIDTDSVRQTLSNLLTDQLTTPTLPEAKELVAPWGHSLKTAPLVAEFDATEEQLFHVIERLIQAAE